MTTTLALRSRQWYATVSFLSLLMLLTIVQVHASPTTITVSGSATYLQRIAMPPNAEFHVYVEDVSLMDAPARVLAEQHQSMKGKQVPISFSLNVPAKEIDPRMRYAVRANITLNGKLFFTTTQHYAVLSQGASNKVQLLLSGVTSAPGQMESSKSAAAGIALPATFTGILPCADCSGIVHTLTLLDDGTYRLRLTYLGKSGDPFYETGTWSADSTAKKLRLKQQTETQQFSVLKDGNLRLLDRAGERISTQANLDLRPVKLDVMPKAEVICGNQPCQAVTPTAELKNTYWKLLELDGKAVSQPLPQQREVNLTLTSEGSRVSGFSGCNRFMGGYQQEGNTIHFTQLAGTLMACAPSANQLETQFMQILESANAYQINGDTLQLLNNGKTIARFIAVYLR